MSLSDVLFTIRENLGVVLEQIARWPNQNIANAIEKLGDAKEADSAARNP